MSPMSRPLAETYPWRWSDTCVSTLMDSKLKRAPKCGWPSS